MMELFKKKEIILSKRNYVEYLPVGTIIKLYNDDNKYMIFRYLGNFCMPVLYKDGVLKKSYLYNKSDDMKRTYYHVDYAISPYPSGDLLKVLYIMHEDIEKIIYLGYDDDYRKNILSDIDKWNGKIGDTNE